MSGWISSSRPGPIVVQDNPRLTTAYVALTEALDINVAAANLGVFDQVLAPAPWAIGTGMKTVEVSTARRPVTIAGWDIGGAHVKCAALDAAGPADGRLGGPVPGSGSASIGSSSRGPSLPCPRTSAKTRGATPSP